MSQGETGRKFSLFVCRVNDVVQDQDCVKVKHVFPSFGMKIGRQNLDSEIESKKAYDPTTLLS